MTTQENVVVNNSATTNTANATPATTTAVWVVQSFEEGLARSKAERIAEGISSRSIETVREVMKAFANLATVDDVQALSRKMTAAAQAKLTHPDLQVRISLNTAAGVLLTNTRLGVTLMLSNDKSPPTLVTANGRLTPRSPGYQATLDLFEKCLSIE